MKALQITPSELATLLEGAIGSKFVSIETTTDASVFNKGRGEKSMLSMLGHLPSDIKKHSTIVVGTGWDYTKAMKKRLLAEGVEGAEDFEAQAPKGMESVNGSRFIYQSTKDEEQFYLRYYLVEGIKAQSRYTLDGKEFDLSNEAYDTFRKPRKESYGFVRSIKLQNIDRLKIDKQEYRVIK